MHVEVREQLSRTLLLPLWILQISGLLGKCPLSHLSGLCVLKFLISMCLVFLLYTLKALCRAEDEEDIRAATQAKAEQVAELAEFNENDAFPAGEGEEASRPGPGAEDEEMSRAEQEIAALVEQVCVRSTTASLYLS